MNLVNITQVVNQNGAIKNLLFSPVNHVAVIESKAGAVRSNHWHRSSWHYLYVVSGEMIYSERDLDGSNRQVKVIKAGEMVFTPSDKVHKCEFPVDTVMISLTNNTSKDAHEQDLVKEEF